jgi:hypothetical protein
MKPIYQTILALLVMIGFAAVSSVSAQTSPDQVVRVTYLQVEKDDLESFSEQADAWKSHFEDRIEEGDLTEWRLYHVPFSSSGMWYNAVAVEIGDDLSAVEPSSGNRFEAGDDDSVMKLSYAVHSEIWRTEAEVWGTGDSPARYMNVNFMFAVPDRLDEYFELEIDIAMPLHQNQVDNERMLGWNFYRLVFPTGTSVAYNFMTADFYDSLEQIEMGITREVIEEVHPEMDVDEFEDFADSIRERVWSDLWELAAYVR